MNSGPPVHLSPSHDKFSKEILHALGQFLEIPSELAPFALEMGAIQISWPEFYSDFVLPQVGTLDPSIQDQVMIEFLRDLPVVGTTIRDKLQQAKFVPSLAGTYCAPVQLYDPSVTLLHSLLEDNRFPAAPFDTPAALAALRELGLHVSLAASTLRSTAKSVSYCYYTFVNGRVIHL